MNNKKQNCKNGSSCKSDIYEKVVETLQEEIENYKLIIKKNNIKIKELEKKLLQFI